KSLKKKAEDSTNHLCRIQETFERLDMENEKDKMELMNNSLFGEERDCNENSISHESSQNIKER
ncbi:hypothetical protein ACJMK2_044441, partial [Sinanodonta woodiana]